MKKGYTPEELDRWIREAQMNAEFPHHRAHGMYGDPKLDKINRDKKVMKKEFLDLGKQPIANKFLREDEFDDEFFYNLKVVFDDDTKLVSLKDFVKPELMFNDDYVYHTSLSVPMVKHFKETAEMLMKEFNQIGRAHV